MEIKVNAIVLKSIDYKENDKLLTLFSLELGKITAGIKGVKKSGAKLKFASEPFCFAEYILVEKGGRYTVINATYLDSFYNLRLDLKKYYTANVISNAVYEYALDGEPNENLFDFSLNAIKNICYGEKIEIVSTLKFLLNLTADAGYQITAGYCSSCGCDISGRAFFNFDTVEFMCEKCVDNATEITLTTYRIISDLSEKDSLSDDSYELEHLKKALKFLNYYLLVKTDIKLTSIEFLISNF